ncbi:hypothetical protein B0H19DRAFT_859305, partial [Mycena capillaripes]
MINTGLKYGLCFDTIDQSRKIREEFPLFHHFGEDKSKLRINNTGPCKCIRANHQGSNMGHALIISLRLEEPDHIPDKSCPCDDCTEDRASGCKNPHGCAKTANLKLDSIVIKW